jgi:endonuclease/exonuclease/phosphatase family metal-dependent hydrolase
MPGGAPPPKMLQKLESLKPEQKETKEKLALWNFRPTALGNSCYPSIEEDILFEHYIEDNERAQSDGVSVPLRKKELFRTCQWNINNFNSPDWSCDRNGIMDTLFEVDADVIILNEYFWDERSSIHEDLEKRLQERGYKIFTASVFAPTAVATRLVVDHVQELSLDEERSAISIRLGCGVWIFATHLCDYSAVKRLNEVNTLLMNLSSVKETERVIVVGDFNQQRDRDYSVSEWQTICASKKRRNVPRDDGVASLMDNAGFFCIFDQASSCNWRGLPPSTHWTGTIVDYSYFRNLYQKGVYVNTSELSDHRLIACDWSW